MVIKFWTVASSRAQNIYNHLEIYLLVAEA